MGAGGRKCPASTKGNLLDRIAGVHHGQIKRLVERAHHPAGRLRMGATDFAPAAATRGGQSIRRKEHCRDEDREDVWSGSAETGFHDGRMQVKGVWEVGGKALRPRRSAMEDEAGLERNERRFNLQRWVSGRARPHASRKHRRID